MARGITFKGKHMTATLFPWVRTLHILFAASWFGAAAVLTLYLLPATWTVAIVGFVVFRAFDIVKPFPARRLEALHGGWGMMADDLMAAIYANLALRAAIAMAPGFMLR